MRRGRCLPLSPFEFNPRPLPVPYPPTVVVRHPRNNLGVSLPLPIPSPSSLSFARLNSNRGSFHRARNLPEPGITSGTCVVELARAICVRLSRQDYRQIRKMMAPRSAGVVVVRPRVS